MPAFLLFLRVPQNGDAITQSCQFGPGSGLDFEKLLGFNRAGHRSKIEIFSE